MEALPIDLRAGDWVRIRDNFGEPRPGHAHRGNDIGAPRGRTIRAPVAGRIVRAHDVDNEACGFGVILDGTDGRRWTLCHFEAPPVVFTGEHVQAGDALGTLGASGNATWTDRHGTVHRAYHLHIARARLTPSDRRMGVPENLYGELVEARARAQGVALDASTRRELLTSAAPARSSSRSDAAGGGLALAFGLGLLWWSRRQRT